MQLDWPWDPCKSKWRKDLLLACWSTPRSCRAAPLVRAKVTIEAGGGCRPAPLALPEAFKMLASSMGWPFMLPDVPCNNPDVSSKSWCAVSWVLSASPTVITLWFWVDIRESGCRWSPTIARSFDWAWPLLATAVLLSWTCAISW